MIKLRWLTDWAHCLCARMFRERDPRAKRMLADFILDLSKFLPYVQDAFSAEEAMPVVAGREVPDRPFQVLTSGEVISMLRESSFAVASTGTAQAVRPVPVDCGDMTAKVDCLSAEIARLRVQVELLRGKAAA